ncbi:MAG: GreA/GreB family elongation factor [Bacillota bacterium]|jgi:transcription elongation factor GreA|nr:GreA/GreB family elongation factor [Bacillota bacterium]
MDENKVIALTVEGLRKLEKEQIKLLHVERVQVVEELKAARSQGDLSENADYDAARDHQARVEATIKENDYVLTNFELIDLDEKTSKDKLQVELENLREEKIAVNDKMNEAKKDGVSDENEELFLICEKLAEIETRIRIVEYALKNDSTKKIGKKAVKLGSKVTILTLDEELEEVYTIVGTVEADPINGKISNETPLASALLDRKVGDVVTVFVAHPYKVQIKKID